MGRKKSIVKIPSSALVRCPHCGKKSIIALDKENAIYYLDCKKCGQKIETPPAYCCLICAFSKKKCPQSLIMEAKMKNLEIKYDSKVNDKINVNNNILSGLSSQKGL